MFKKFIDELLKSTTQTEIDNILSRENGVESSFQSGKLSKRDYHRLRKLSEKITYSVIH